VIICQILNTLTAWRLTNWVISTVYSDICNILVTWCKSSKIVVLNREVVVFWTVCCNLDMHKNSLMFTVFRCEYN